MRSHEVKGIPSKTAEILIGLVSAHGGSERQSLFFWGSEVGSCGVQMMGSGPSTLTVMRFSYVQVRTGHPQQNWSNHVGLFFDWFRRKGRVSTPLSTYISKDGHRWPITPHAADMGRWNNGVHASKDFPAPPA